VPGHCRQLVAFLARRHHGDALSGLGQVVVCFLEMSPIAGDLSQRQPGLGLLVRTLQGSAGRSLGLVKIIGEKEESRFGSVGLVTIRVERDTLLTGSEGLWSRTHAAIGARQAKLRLVGCWLQVGCVLVGIYCGIKIQVVICAIALAEKPGKSILIFDIHAALLGSGTV